MDMNQFRPDFHIAQQSRRDKLRIQNDPNASSPGIYSNNNLEPEGLNYVARNWRAGNICYELPSEMYQDPEKRVETAPYHENFVSNEPPYFSTSDNWVFGANANYQNALQELVTSSSHVEGWGGQQALSLSLSSSSSVPSQNIPAAWKKPEAGRVQTLNHRNPGPLGPFTGYATILTSSKFLRPAQQLLEDLCCMARPKDIQISDAGLPTLDQLLRVSTDSSSFLPFNASKDNSHRPDNLQKKAKLLYMQDEVCKRYKQYHQQMQMVVSSFETVAGLSAATPYVSLALKMIAKHFRCLKNTITDQLKSIKNSLGEELSSPSAGTSSSKGDAAGVSMLKFFDQNFQKQKGAANLGILENQHIWRPQRGLPERAVSILRAWLFDHFLHPYPTDTDKHMLATQTGLTRNQVSNWFINARVRVWKPMVEEIHMLETKGVPADQTESNGGNTSLEGLDHQANDQSSSQSLNRLRMSAIPDRQVDCSTAEHLEYEVGRSNANIWNQEKRSRIEYHIPSSIDGSLMGLVPSGIEMGGLGSVSLTLGLRQSAENAQRQPLPEHHLRPHMGGQIIRDFVG